MKTYIKLIQFTQKFLLILSIGVLLLLPIIIVFSSELISEQNTLFLYDLSHIVLFFVMIIRPLADIFSNISSIRPLVILRKGAGVFSASIILSFIFAKIIIAPNTYFHSLFTYSYWSLNNFALLAHLADISAIILIITSNNFSKRVLGYWWKKIQKLSYVYFYASASYVFFISNDTKMLISILLVTMFTMLAHIKNQKRQNLQTKTV